ncbi:MAG TPA: zinc-binding alcohol dehydrogenase family protein [Acidimicrobiales bacterium]|jgi:NADPH:quinone reductase-like Zn-dependent oxidoreductase|nr:zinc-binding alcohol dehydrogenase family protein [Acidimicrobiales bacterium]
MYAAVVDAFGQPPHYREFETPQPVGEHEALVEVVASGLHPRVRSQATGTHYTSTEELPLIPGIDGVGRLASGGLVYFVLPDTTMGAMAQHTVIDLRRCIHLPDETDPLLVAAAMNPGMSSWVALRKRVRITPGQSVLILGATGSAGQLAIQVARHLGAGHIIGAGRDATRLGLLPGLGAHDVVSLTGAAADVAEALGKAASHVDVVLDYLWGTPAEEAMLALARGRADPGQPLHWVQIGAVAGPTAQIPSAALRSTNLCLMGSGQGSVPTRDILSELPALATEIAHGTFELHVEAEPLSLVESVWTKPVRADGRIVLTPSMT